ncbi:MAG TPA: hypothetical protein PLV56_03915 [Synergistales bacterium]|nr:hypothetical protein [Synergistales bacterium]
MSRIIESPFGSPFSKWFKIASVIVGSAFTYAAYLRFSTANSAGASSYLLVGALCFLFLTHRKRLYISEKGIVREQSLLKRNHVELFPWSQVKAVTFLFHGENLVVLFERGFKGWRVVYSRNDEAILRQYINEMRPDITIETMSK